MTPRPAIFDSRKIPVVKVLLPFVAGVVPGSLITVPIPFLGLLVPALFGWVLLLLLLLRRPGKSAFPAWVFCFLARLICFASGWGSGWITRPVDPELPVGDPVVIRGMLVEDPVQVASGLRAEVLLQMLYVPDTVLLSETRLQVYFTQDRDTVLPGEGETWQWTGVLSPIRNSGNPGSPDYESLMQRRNCWYRFYVTESGDRAEIKTALSSPLPVAGRIRHALSEQWEGGEEEIALLKAVCLGDRSSLTRDLLENYGAAGGMHLLAVSGLHVGLIWWVLQHTIRWILRRTRREIYRTLTVVAMLWFYAYITGFSSSVCRAVTMCSLFSAGRLLGQRTQMLNGIFVSAFILLVIQPGRLMELGFQLSYTAILGIVTLHPLLRKLLTLRYRLFNWLWEAASVSVSAQLFTLPLVVFHFHQVPLYSVLTSILAVPLLGLLIVLFCASLPFLGIGPLHRGFDFLLGSLAKLMNLTMEKVAALPGALLEEVPLSSGMLILLLLLLGMWMLALQGRSRLPAYLVCFMLSLLTGYHAWTKYCLARSSEVLVCHFSGASMVILREAERVDHYCWGSDSTSISYLQSYRSEAWSGRTYKNHLFRVGDTVLIRGSVSACMELTEGIWWVGNDRIGVWVVTGKAKSGLPADMLDEWAGTGRKAPDFILLSGEPYDFALRAHAAGWTLPLVMDGSNRSTFREKVRELEPGIHDTRGQGPFGKRW